MRIALLNTPGLSAVWYYRLLPWHYFARQTDANFSVLSADQPGAFESIVPAFDVLIISRPHTKTHLFAMETAKRYGVKIVADYDDFIWEIPQDNPHARSNEDDNFQWRAIEALTMADLVISSTGPLAAEMERRFGVSSHLIRNALNDFREVPAAAANPINLPVRIAWRGSNTHKADLLSVRRAFRHYFDTEFHFFGYYPGELLAKYSGELEYINHTPWHPVVDQAFASVRNYRPNYFIVPLDDNLFNQCKSNIAWIEATACGAVTIAPAYMQEYADVPCMHYTDEAELVELLGRLSAQPDEYRQLVYTQARDKLVNSYLLSDMNELRLAALNSLTAQAVDMAP